MVYISLTDHWDFVREHKLAAAVMMGMVLMVFLMAEEQVALDRNGLMHLNKVECLAAPLLQWETVLVERCHRLILVGRD